MSGKDKGFTLMELLTVLAIASIMAAMAAPNFSDTIKNNRIRSSAENIHALVRFARAEAARQGRSVSVGALDGLNWNKGGLAWVENDNVNGFNPLLDTELRRFDVSDTVNIVEASGLTRITFNGQGYSAVAVDLFFCDGRADETGRRLSILTSGFSALANKEDCQ